MIISHKYKYIFIKTTKTAGTSVEISLSRFCGEDDIVTPLMEKDEVIRCKHGGKPQNFMRPLHLSEYSKGDWWRCVSQLKRPAKIQFWNHITAAQIKSRIAPEIWDSYYKFCFVRNPWDRAISRYFWNIEKTGNHEELEASLRNNDPNSNFDIYSIGDQVAVDFVGKYENLAVDLGTVCQHLDIPFDGWLPRAKGTARKTRQHYSNILNPQQAEYIHQKCSREIDLFGYQFAQIN
ncbi:MAG: sulfotransferase family 2 domain-containing protein [Leptolyngbyaceae cyanobacterium]